MDREDFERHFRLISESLKRENSDVTTSGRPKIGKIGIGFIAANEICNVMRIISTKRDSNELLNVAINFEIMRQDISDRRRDNTQLATADYTGVTETTELDAHYTHIFLEDIRGEAQAILSGVGATGEGYGTRSLYGLNPTSVRKILLDANVNSWSHFDAYSKNILEIGLNVPVSYQADWYPSEYSNVFKKYEDRARLLNFNVTIDGAGIRKPTMFRETSRGLAKPFVFKGESTSAEGYLYAQSESVRPQDIQGLLLRIRNSAVGMYDHSFLGFSPTIAPLIQRWVSAEIYADDRLEEAMNIDRRTLRVTHPAYVELRNAIHAGLHEFLNEVRSSVYGSNTRERRTVRAFEAEERLVRVVANQIAPNSPEVAETITQVWTKDLEDESGEKRLLRTYSVDRFYEIVTEVASEMLAPQQFAEFMRRLTERIRS